MVIFGLDIVLWANGIHSQELAMGLALLQAGAFIAFAHMAINQPRLVVPQAQTATTKPINRPATLTSAHMERLSSKLQQAIANDQLFKHNDLSLRQLSDTTGIAENHISETFSQHLNTNFFHFVNGYRVEHAMHLLKSTDLSITTIAYEAGFNSRSTFNNAFKKTNQLTPTAFRQQNTAV